MPYLHPERTLERFASYAIKDVRPVIEDEFERAQVGSMGSTLRFTSREVGGMHDAVSSQQTAFLDALAELDGELSEQDKPAVAAAVTRARDQLDSSESEDAYTIEETLLSACNDIFAAIEEDADPTRRSALRTPLYSFLESRVNAQLRLLGRSSTDS